MDDRILPWRNQVQVWWTQQQTLQNQPSNNDFYWLLQTEYPRRSAFDWLRSRTREQLIGEVRQFSRLSVVDVATVIGEPQNVIALQIAESLLPEPYSEELKVLHDVIDAAATKNLKLRKRYTIGAVSAGVLLITYFNGWGRPSSAA
jgi:hypothetical protein